MLLSEKYLIRKENGRSFKWAGIDLFPMEFGSRTEALDYLDERGLNADNYPVFVVRAVMENLGVRTVVKRA